MENSSSWSKLTDKQRYNRGVWIVVSTLTLVISSGVTFLIALNNNYQKKIDIAVSNRSKADSLKIVKLEAESKYKDDRYYKSLENIEKRYFQLVEKSTELKNSIDEKK